MIWTMKDGTEIPTENMTHSHRVNSIKMLIRKDKYGANYLDIKKLNTPEGSLALINQWLEMVQEYQDNLTDIYFDIDWRY